MIYMKSNSANDGSYTLTVTLRARHQPGHQHRQRQQPGPGRAVASAGRGAAQRRDGGKKQSARRSWSSSRSRARAPSRTPLFISNYVTINVLDTAQSRVPGVGQASLFGALDYSMRIWFDTDRLIQLEPGAVRHHRRHPARRTSRRAVGRVGARPTCRRHAVPDQPADQGTPGPRPRSSARSWCAPTPTARCCGCATSRGSSSGAATQDSLSRLNGQPAVSIGIYLAPGANAVATSKRVQAALDRAVDPLSPTG